MTLRKLGLGLVFLAGAIIGGLALAFLVVYFRPDLLVRTRTVAPAPTAPVTMLPPAGAVPATEVDAPADARPAAVAMRSFSIAVVSSAVGSVTLSWDPPTQRDDGTPLNDLAGYKLYWGTALGHYPNLAAIPNPGIATYVVDELTPGTYYLVATAYDSSGMESDYSNVATETIP